MFFKAAIDFESVMIDLLFNFRLRQMFLRLLNLIIVCCALSVVASAQIPTPNNSKHSSHDDDDPFALNSPQMEMLARKEIEMLEKERKENLQRTQEAVQLGTNLRDAYQANKTFLPNDLKKLERLEKIAKRVRSEAGGSEGEPTNENNPKDLETALDMLVESSENMRKGVEKTPRQVVSASVIEQSNKLLQIIRFVKVMAH